MRILKQCELFISVKKSRPVMTVGLRPGYTFVSRFAPNSSQQDFIRLGANAFLHDRGGVHPAARRLRRCWLARPSSGRLILTKNVREQRNRRERADRYTSPAHGTLLTSVQLVVNQEAYPKTEDYAGQRNQPDFRHGESCRFHY